MDVTQAQAQMSSYQGQISQQRANIRAIDAKIARLRTAYDEVRAEGDELSRICGLYLGDQGDASTWSGDLRSDHDGAATGDVPSARDAYMRQVDACRDAIRDAITRLENQKVEANGLIGWLQSAWNELCGWVEKQTN